MLHMFVATVALFCKDKKIPIITWVTGWGFFLKLEAEATEQLHTTTAGAAKT